MNKTGNCCTKMISNKKRMHLNGAFSRTSTRWGQPCTLMAQVNGSKRMKHYRRYRAHYRQ